MSLSSWHHGLFSKREAGKWGKNRSLGIDCLEDRIVPATRIWDGEGANANWNTALNWVGDVAPVANDDLVFPDGALQLNNFNNFAVNTVFRSVTFTGPGYTLNGNAITLDLNFGSPGIVGADAVAATSNVINFDVRLGTSQTFFVGVNHTITFGSTAQILGINTAPNVIGESLTKTGVGTLVLGGNSTLMPPQINTYTGDTIINAGTIRLGAFNETLSDLTDVFVANGATFDLNGRIETVASLSGSGNVNLPGASFLALDFDSMTAQFDGVFAGTGNIAKSGNGTQIFGGSSVYTGTTFVVEGTLIAENDNALGSAANGTNVFAGASLIVRGGITIQAETISITGPGASAQSGALSTGDAATNTLNGLVIINGDADIGGEGGRLVINGVISGGALNKTGAGIVEFNANNTYVGLTTLFNGLLLVNGQQPTSDIFLNGGTIGGIGRVGAISAGIGGISPGEGPGILSSGSVIMNDRTRYEVELNGDNPGIGGYDQLNVAGAVVLNGAVLDVTLGFPGAIQKEYTILNNDGTDAIVGIFAGLPEGEFFGASGGPASPMGGFFTITYVGGDGNDVVITQLDLQGILSPSATYVTALYWELLDRTPDAAGLEYWTGLLEIGRLNRAEVAREIYLSTESLERIVNGYYRQFLGRDADPEGLAGWVQELRTNLSEEEVMASFLSSDEYLALYPDASDYVESLYLNVLGRNGEEPGKSGWITVLGNKGASVVANSFVNSAEFYTNVVYDYYWDYLRRQPDDPYAEDWVGDLLLEELTINGMAIDILASEEFYDKLV